MEKQQLWAPWRLAYVQGQESTPAANSDCHWLEGADERCFLCRDVAEKDPARDRLNLVIRQGHETLSVLNRFPYNNGHLLVAPRRHVAKLQQLTPGEQRECCEEITRLVGLLEQRLNAEGFNVGLNLGRIAGAGLPGHLHWHIVPRWQGDTNFMPCLAGVRVIPQALDALWELLADHDPASQGSSA